MEEDAGVKAPVTRLRRRLSVEQSEESKSPALNTPTKKRGGRRAKPELELIDENNPDNTTSKTKKTTAKEIKDTIEEKPLTPSRRSTRIKSNTSIVSETAITVDSPRAKRAARRTSAVGSDSEAPATPIRQTRRTRKDSASSVEKAELPSISKPATQITEVIIEEPESSGQKSTAKAEDNDNSSPSSIRKSPRLVAKHKTPSKKNSQENDNTGEQSENVSSKKSIDSPLSTSQETEDTIKTKVSSKDHKEADSLSISSSNLLKDLHVTVPKIKTDNLNKTTSDIESKQERLVAKHKTPSKKNPKENDKVNDNTGEQSESASSKKSIDSPLSTSQETEDTIKTRMSSKDHKEADRLSISSSNLLKDLHLTVPKIKTDNLNKTTSDIESKQEKTKRKRTKSWTTLTVANESNFYSDNESTKKKVTKNPNSLIQLNKRGSGDALINTSIQEKSFSRRKKNDSNNFIVEEIDTSLNKSKSKSRKEANKDNSLSANQDVTEKSDIFELFKKEPSNNMQTLVLIENDSDSNLEKDIQNKCQNEDQCVPVVEHPVRLEKEEELNLISKNQSIINECKMKSSLNDSCEPMDVDETIPESLIVEMQMNENNSSKINSISQFSQLDNSLSSQGKLNKSKRKSSISNNLEKSENENKSTLILSQIKDTSSIKSPQIKTAILSKTVEDLNVTQENEVNKRNISLNCVTTSTPLQQKNLQKLALNVNTSMISTNDDSKNVIENVNISKNKNDVVDKGEKSSNENDSSEDEKDIKEITKISEKPNNSKIMDSNVKIEVGQKMSNDNSNDTKNQTLNLSKKNLSGKQKDSDTDLESDAESLNIKRKRKPQKSSKKMSDTSRDMDSKDEVESDDGSQDTSNLLDDKADDAGDDYESGDSQDDSEREYVEQHEILEKGETLTSEDDFSDDSDYEKDSFVVSSAEEDNELLDGTENDLSMSDNELKMSNKSKKKYNERKLKEQKKASKEMYESRHKLNTSSKTKKKQQISSSESENESGPKPKKNNRMRLNSTNETSMIEDKDEQIKSKDKTKRLSTSVCEESGLNEREITIANESIKDVDPLKTQIKEEPKTPKKENMSVAFIDSEEINNDEVDNNELTRTQTEIDPLDESMEDEDSLSSDTEIINNYDSVLKDLSKNNKAKTKTYDISLNLDKKSKKQKLPIVDELNLTQVKSSKKDKNKITKEADKSKEQNGDDGTSSDSIDLHLLFSEDSNQSDDVQKKDDNEEEFIPLKRKDGKTDIRENNDASIEVCNNTSLNVSLKKNKKRKSKIDNNIDSNDTEDKVSFFVDTEGTHTSVNESINTSLKNKKRLSTQNNNSQILSQKENGDIHMDQDETDFGTNQSMNKSLTKTPVKNKKKTLLVNEKQQEDDSDEAPTEVSFIKEKRQNKTEDETDMATNKSITKTSASEKKKKKKNAHVENETDLQEGQALNTTLTKTPASQKKKKRTSISQNDINEPDSAIDTSLNQSSSDKKKKNSSIVTKEIGPNEEDIQEEQPNNVSLIKTPVSQKKKKKRTSVSQNEINDGVEEVDINISLNKKPYSGKKKKQPLISTHNDQPEPLIEDVSKIKTPGSLKKREKSQENVQESLNVSKIKTPGSKKKIVQESQEQRDTPDIQHTSSKKRKRSLNMTVEEIGEDAENNVPTKLNESLVSSQKKKLKISQQSEEAIEINQEETKVTDGKKKKNLRKPDNLNVDETPGIEILKANRNKRKQREDDDENIVSKVLKQNSFDKKVPRLPPSILNQLDENPQKESHVPKKAKVISTTDFVVEEARKRRNKPSNYLEESVYLNDDESENKKLKKRLLKPKVLPFVPTALTSGSGYTTNFKVNVVPKETKFIAQTSNISNFKEEYLNKKIKRQGTYELYKRNRNIKISKF